MAPSRRSSGGGRELARRLASRGQRGNRIGAFEITQILEVASWDHNGEPHYGIFFAAKTSTTDVELSEEHADSLWTSDPNAIDGLDFWNSALPRIAKSVLKA